MAPVLEAKANVAGAGSQTTTGIDTSDADFLLVVLTTHTTPDTGNFSDSKSNSWSWLSTYGGGTNNFNVKIGYCNDPTVGTGHTVTNDSSYHVLFFYAFSGMSGWTFDTENGGEDSDNTGSITPDQVNEFLVTAVCAGVDSCDNCTVDGGFTLEDQVPYDSGVNPGGAVAFDLVYPSTDSESCTWTDVTPANNGLTIAAFKSGISIPAIMHHLRQQGIA